MVEEIVRKLEALNDTKIGAVGIAVEFEYSLHEAGFGVDSENELVLLEDEISGTFEENDVDKALRSYLGSLNAEKRLSFKGPHIVKALLPFNAAIYRRRYSRAYRSPARSTTSAANNDDDGGDGSGSDSEPPSPVPHYYPLRLILQKNEFYSFLQTVASLRLLLLGLIFEWRDVA